jgi:predicted transcriptional regulator
MYCAYLSFSQAQEYLGFLIARNLVSREPGTGLYLLTGRGMELVDTCEGLGNLVKLAPFDNVDAGF